MGIGVDAVEIGRFRVVVARRPGILDRVFTEAERAYASRARDPAPRLAARFAAKEAAMKALGVGLGAFALREVELVREQGGEPRLRLRGGAAAVAATRGVASWTVTLTHTDELAIAVAVALGP